MKIEEAKALFFAQYYDQVIMRLPGVTYRIDCYNLSMVTRSNEIASAYLLLRSVNQLTEEQKINIAELEDHRANHLQKVNDDLQGWKEDRYNFIDSCVYQYLLRIGILLPFTYLNEENKPVTLQPEEIIALKWAQY
ncbi:MAG: hypothetical protein JWR05_3506 [Mucilaginibacter sp.]|nr:hypothetical protein [Mucilaginibacter sp.]